MGLRRSAGPGRDVGGLGGSEVIIEIFLFTFL